MTEEARQELLMIRAQDPKKIRYVTSVYGDIREPIRKPEKPAPVLTWIPGTGRLYPKRNYFEDTEETE